MYWKKHWIALPLPTFQLNKQITDETHISTSQAPPQNRSRFPQAYANCQWPRSFSSAPQKGT
jgi:hypothetical protein